MSTFVPARQGYGAVFSLSTMGSTGTFTPCMNVLNINPPSFSRGTVDVTGHGTTDAYEQAISGGIIRSGDLSFTAVYLSTNTQQTTLIPEAFSNGANIGWLITIPGTSSNNVLFGDGYITAYTPFTVPTEGRVEYSVSLKVKGKPLLQSGTSS